MARWACVTGGTRGLGLEVAKCLAVEGYDLILGYLGNHDNARMAVLEVNRLAPDRQCQTVAFDASIPRDCLTFTQKVFTMFHDVEILVHCPALRCEEGAITTALLVQAEKAFTCATAIPRLFAERFNDQGCGRIVLITSTAARYPFPAGSEAYPSTKGAQESLCRSMAGRCSHHVRVNCVAPGVMQEEGQPASGALHRFVALNHGPDFLIDPAEVAGVVMELTRETCRISGQTIDVDAGLSLQRPMGEGQEK